jgi:hypothetical protein
MTRVAEEHVPPRNGIDYKEHNCQDNVEESYMI